MSGDMTVGMLTGFYMAAVNFLQPIGRFIQFADMFQILEADLQRLDDVFDATEDLDFFEPVPDAARDRASTFAGRLRLKGRIELRNVTFGYQDNREPLLEDFSLAIEPGHRVAIVGPSGSGKSTIASLVAGIHQPWSGEVLIDGHPRSAIPRELMTDSVSLVDQHIFLFADTVRENLTMWIPEVPDQALVAAARDATIHEEIISRPLGYDAPVEEGGTQLQRRPEAAAGDRACARQQPVGADPGRGDLFARHDHRGPDRRRPAAPGVHLPHRGPSAEHHPRLRSDRGPRPGPRGAARHP